MEILFHISGSERSGRGNNLRAGGPEVRKELIQIISAWWVEGVESAAESRRNRCRERERVGQKILSRGLVISRCEERGRR